MYARYGTIIGVASPSSWLARYRAGERGPVWHELRQLGSTVRNSGLHWEAQAVCDEMARRARQNVEAIVERLSSAGYRFHRNDNAQTPTTSYVPPTAAAREHADWLDERFGPLPMTLRSWTLIVGDVWLVGTHPQWAASASADPLVIEVEGSLYADDPIRNYFEESHESWQEYRDMYSASSQFVLPLAPDSLHKQNISGGDPYGIILPDGCADGLFAGATVLPFVSYLNQVFASGGFLSPTASAEQVRVTDALARDLLRL
jgi:hypothetical protein